MDYGEREMRLVDLIAFLNLKAEKRLILAVLFDLLIYSWALWKHNSHH